MPLALSFLVALAVLPAQAAPAPWYVWESQASAQRVCAQPRPGSARRRVDGPYRNAACRAAPYPVR